MRDHLTKRYTHAPRSRTSALLQKNSRPAAPGVAWLLMRSAPGSPYDAAGGWRKARRVAAWMRPVFRQDKDVLSKNPVTRPRTWRAQPVRRVIRGALSFGYFSLGKQRKVTRAAAAARKPAAAARKPAAGEPGRRIATTKHRGFGRSAIRLSRSASCLRRNGEQKLPKPGRRVETLPRAPAPHPNPLPAGERKTSYVGIRQKTAETPPPSAPHPRHRYPDASPTATSANTRC